MSHEITYSAAIDQAINAVMHHCADDENRLEIVKRLDALKNFERNMGVLSLAMCNIRADAIRARYAIKHEDEVLNELKKIERAADSMHNVGTFMVSGIACNAAYLLHHGVDERWPTGINESEPSRANIERIKNALKIDVMPLPGYEDRSALDKITL